MLTLKFFDGFVKSFTKPSVTDHELMTWAKIEYKNDAQWAFDYMKQSGGIPPNGGHRAYEMAI